MNWPSTHAALSSSWKTFLCDKGKSWLTRKLKERADTAMRQAALASLVLIALQSAAIAEWSVETVTDDRSGRQITRALLHEFGGRATLVIQCSQQAADAVVYLREPAEGSHLQLIYRFDDEEPQHRMVPVSPAGHVLRIWNDAEKEAFSHAKRLRIQTKPFVVFDFDLRGIETIASKLKC